MIKNEFRDWARSLILESNWEPNSSIVPVLDKIKAWKIQLIGNYSEQVKRDADRSKDSQNSDSEEMDDTDEGVSHYQIL